MNSRKGSVQSRKKTVEGWGEMRKNKIELMYILHFNVNILKCNVARNVISCNKYLPKYTYYVNIDFRTLSTLQVMTQFNKHKHFLILIYFFLKVL